MYHQTIQESLFPTKRELSFEAFQRNYLTPEFTTCITESLVDAFNQLTSTSIFDDLSLRSRANDMHELIFANIKRKADTSMPDDPIYVYSSPSGNKREFIIYKDATFIVKKDITQKNDTEVTRIIDEQASDKHIITIQCNISKMWDYVKSVSFLYIQNGVSIFTHEIDLTDKYTQDTFRPETVISEDVDALKPKLKAKKAVEV